MHLISAHPQLGSLWLLLADTSWCDSNCEEVWPGGGAGGGVAGQAVSLPLGTQKDIPEFQVAGVSATVTPVVSRWLVIQLWASNVTVVFFILGGGGQTSLDGDQFENVHHSSVAHHPPTENLLRNLHTHTFS